jgi:hypothetical protein
MFGLFKKKKKDAKPADKSAGKGKDAAIKQAAPKAPKAAAPADKKPAKKSDPEQDALKAAIAILEGDALAPPPPPAKPLSAGANLDKAREALAKKGSAPMDRKALIEQALAIQQTQAKMLDKLPDATRQKLRALAMKTFGTDAPDDKKKMN